MKNDNFKLIPYREFIAKYPSQVQELAKRYDMSTKTDISVSTFQHYMTKKLIPHPTTRNRIACYKDSPEMYKRVFIACYLHSKRMTLEDRLKIVEKLKLPDDVDTVSMFLNDDCFLKNVILSDNVKEANDKSFGPNKCTIGMKSLFYIVKYLLIKNMEEFEEILSCSKENSATVKQCEEISERLGFYRETREDLTCIINRTKSFVRKAKLSKNKKRILRPIFTRKT